MSSRLTRGRPASRARRLVTTAAVAVTASLALGAAAAGACAPFQSKAVDPTKAHNSVAAQPASVNGTCFWGRVDGPIDGRNILGPDTNVGYWYERFQLPAGAKVVLHGQYPHARFMSLTTYGTVDGQAGTATGSFADTDINPDKGSINPFRPGALRVYPKRAFTLTLSSDVDPGAANRAANTFYVGHAGHTDGTQTVEMILRIYRVDEGKDMAGGVPLPTPTLVLANGQQATGQAACDAVQSITGAANLPNAGAGLPDSTYLNLLHLPGASPQHPATSPITWSRFFNNAYLLAPFYQGTDLASKLADLPTTLVPGFYPTPANAYVIGYADRSFGPDSNGHNILVLRGTMPTHPDTFSKDPINTRKKTQVRYWSLCNYTGLAVSSLLKANTDCLFDQEIPVDRHGNFTIVISLPQDRPANASARCGVAWMDWGTAGDGVAGGDDKLITLVMRNQLADPSFAQGIDKVTTPGTEKHVMGDYLPSGSYTTKAQFQRAGC
ncbi:MAG TPA: hypothetical protein VH395_15515 [Jatrophihabitantaceae bacterium]|jgi:hypothetical protein